MIHRLTKVLESTGTFSRLTHTQANILFVPIDVDGDITEVRVKCAANLTGGGSALFNARLSGVPVWSGGSRLAIASGSHTGSKTSLSIAVVENDEVQIDLEQMPGVANIALPLVVTILVDDGIADGGGNSSIVFLDDFEDGSVNAAWAPDSGLTLTETSGLLHLAASADKQASLGTYLPGVLGSFEAKLAGTVPVGSTQFQGIGLTCNGNSAFMYTQNGKIYAYIDTDLTASILVDPYVQATHAYFRIVIAAPKTLMFQYSTDGQTWVTIYTKTGTLDWSGYPNSVNGLLRLWTATSKTVDFDNAAIRSFLNL